VVLERAIVPELEASGYGIQIEMLSVAARRGFQIDEVPIIFIDRENEDSKLDITSDTQICDDGVQIIHSLL
jgi:hypothetical protein